MFHPPATSSSMCKHGWNCTWEEVSEPISGFLGATKGDAGIALTLPRVPSCECLRECARMCACTAGGSLKRSKGPTSEALRLGAPSGGFACMHANSFSLAALSPSSSRCTVLLRRPLLLPPCSRKLSGDLCHTGQQQLCELFSRSTTTAHLWVEFPRYCCAPVVGLGCRALGQWLGSLGRLRWRLSGQLGRRRWRWACQLERLHHHWAAPAPLRKPTTS